MRDRPGTGWWPTPTSWICCVRGRLAEAASTRNPAGSTRPRRVSRAEALWGDGALEDLAEAGCARAEIEALHERRLAAVEDRLTSTSRWPGTVRCWASSPNWSLRIRCGERLRAQHMLALYRSGQQGAALASYRELRELLADELGVDPTPTSQRLEQAVLRQDLRWTRRYRPSSAA